MTPRPAGWTGSLSAIYGPVRALAVTDDTVYVGGNFTNTKDGTRTRLAAYNRADGAILPWAPTADRRCWPWRCHPTGAG